LNSYKIYGNIIFCITFNYYFRSAQTFVVWFYLPKQRKPDSSRLAS